MPSRPSSQTLLKRKVSSTSSCSPSDPDGKTTSAIDEAAKGSVDNTEWMNERMLYYYYVHIIVTSCINIVLNCFLKDLMTCLYEKCMFQCCMIWKLCQVFSVWLDIDVLLFTVCMQLYLSGINLSDSCEIYTYPIN